MFNLAGLEKPELISRLDLSNKPIALFRPAFKIIKFYDIRSVDMSNLGIQDEHMMEICEYLRGNPCLRSLVLDRNPFTDDGLTRLAKTLHKNTRLAHL